MRLTVVLVACASACALLYVWGERSADRAHRAAVKEAGRRRPLPRVQAPTPEGPGLVTGIVRDAGGNPVGNALVRARKVADDRPLRTSVRTNEEGRFTLRGVPMVKLRLVANTDDAVSDAVVVDPGRLAARTVAFVLRPAGMLTVQPRLLVSGRMGAWRDGPNPGWLRAPAGRIRATVHKGDARYHFDVAVPGRLDFRVPEDAVAVAGSVGVEGARIELKGERATVKGTAGKGGAFRLEGVPPGPARLTVRARGYVPFVRDVVVARGEDIAVRLLPGWSARGQVTDWDGKPVAGARVRGEGHETRSGSDGGFVLGGLPRGTSATLEATAEGYSTARIEAAEGRTAMFRLEPGWTLRGVVGDGAGALVVAYGPGGHSGRPVASAVADGAGAFVLRGLPHGREWLVQALDDGRRSAAAGPLAKPPAEPVRLELRTAGVLRGIVRDKTGAPVEARTVHLVHPQQSVRTGADGRFAFGGLEPGTHFVYTTSDEMKPVEVPEGESAEVELRSAPRYALSGVLLRPDGTPAAGMLLRARGSDWGWRSGFGEVGDRGGGAHTDGEGRFRITGLLGGGRDYTFQVRNETLVGKWRAPAEGLRVKWEVEPPAPTRLLTAAVVDPQGRPIGPASASCLGRFTHSLDVRDGSFQCRLDPDVKEVGIVVREARAPDGSRLPASTLRTRVSVPPPGETLRLQLPPGRLWSGRVVDERGRGIAGAAVEIGYDERQDDRGTRISSGKFSFDYPDDIAVTGADGSFVFPDLSPESFHARVKGPPEFVYAEPFRIDRPEAVPRIVLRDAAVLKGRVVGPDGRGVAQVAVLTSTKAWDGDSDWSGAPFAHTDGRGEFRLGSLVPGREVTLHVRPKAGIATPFLPRKLRGRAGPEPFTIRLERAYWLTGTMFDDRGRVLLEGSLKAVRVGDEEELAGSFLQFGARFQLGPLPEGVYDIHFRSGERWDSPYLLEQPVRVRVPSAPVRIDAVRTWELRGRVARGGRGFFVRWMADAPSRSGRGSGVIFGRDSVPAASVDESGAFLLKNLRERTGWVYVFSERSDRYGLAHVRRGETDVALALEDGFSIRGRYVDGSPFGGLYAVQGALVRAVEVAEDGSFHVRGLPPGRWRIEGGPFFEVIPVTVEAGATGVVVNPKR